MTFSPSFWFFGAALLALLLALAWIDFKTMRLPNGLNGTLALVGLASVYLLGLTSWLDAALGAAIGASVFLGLRWMFQRWRGVEALGLGDVKFMAAAGLWVGLSGLPWLVLVASISGLAYGAAAYPLAQTTRIAFGPHLAAGLAAAWVLKALAFI